MAHKRPPQVIVTWLDAYSQSGLEGKLEAIVSKAELVQRETIGYLLRYDAELTVLAHDYNPSDGDEDDEFSNITVIPSGWVRSVKQGRKRLLPTVKDSPQPLPTAPAE